MSQNLCRRRYAYHKDADRLPYLLALRRLAALGWTDARIAAALTLLDPQTIRELEDRRWADEALDRALDDAGLEDSDRLPWTRKQVEYHRRRRVGSRPRCPGRELHDAYRVRLRAYQTRMGWGRLLPFYDRDRCCWTPGVELAPAECRALSALRDCGPLTPAALARTLGVKRLLGPTGKNLLKRLLQRNLITLVPVGRVALAVRVSRSATCLP